MHFSALLGFLPLLAICCSAMDPKPVSVHYYDDGAVVDSGMFYGQCQDAVTNFDGEATNAELFCECIRSGNHVPSFNNSAELATMEIHNFLPLTNRLEYPFGEQLKWASYLSLFLINSFADSNIRLHNNIFDANCTLGRATQAVSDIFQDNAGAGILAPTCHSASLLVSSFGQHMAMSALNYVVELTLLNDRSTYSSVYRIAPTNTLYIQGLLPVLQNFSWHHMSIIIEGGGVFAEGISLLRQYESPNTYSISEAITVTNMQFSPKKVWDKIRKTGTQLIVVLSHQQMAEWTMCSAFHQNLTTNCTAENSFIFILPSWFTANWFRKNVTMPGDDNRTLHCTEEQMTTMVTYSLSMNRQFYAQNETKELPVTKNVNMSVERWKKLNKHMSNYCYFDGNPKIAKVDPVETDASLHDSMLMFYKTFKDLNKTIGEASPPIQVGSESKKKTSPYLQLDERFNKITGEDLRGLRWLYIYLMGKLNFQGLSGHVYFLPNEKQTFMTLDREGNQAFKKLINTSYPEIAQNFTPSQPTRPALGVYYQRGENGVPVTVGYLHPGQLMPELFYDKLTWPQACGIPNDTLSFDNIQIGGLRGGCTFVPEALKENMGGCQGGLAFLMTTSMLLVLIIMAGIWKVWYSRKLSNAIAKHTKPEEEEEFVVPEQIASKWEIARENIVINRRLGEGAFGAVYGGDIVDESQEPSCVAVAVKTLHSDATIVEKREFLAEGQMMTQFDHTNIVKLIGFCTKEEPFYVVMELMMHGDLRAFLLSHRHLCGTADPSELCRRRLTSVVRQVASGLEYLSSINFVHRDIAARNCMVTVNYLVKIGDFGMSRRMANSDYYRIKGEAPLPVRWMARESLFDGRFDVKSDMWSFGVVMWEVITFGAQPFPGKSNAEVIQHIREGGKLEIPEKCPQKLRNLILSCWTDSPDVRLTAERAVSILENDKEIVVACVKQTLRVGSSWKVLQHALSFSSKQGKPGKSQSLRKADEGRIKRPVSGSADSPITFTNTCQEEPDETKEDMVPNVLYGKSLDSAIPLGKLNPVFSEGDPEAGDDAEEGGEDGGYMNTDLQ
eukprot:scpid20177/ scgid2895/ Insulin receptor; Insulin receptor subunit alpha; Insulin receptor subunit beta